MFMTWRAFAITAVLLAQAPASAGQQSISSFAELLNYGLKNSPVLTMARADTRASEYSSEIADKARLVPRIDLSATYQRATYDRLYNLNGTNVINDGQNPAIAATVTYDLRKVFDPTSEVARQGIVYSRLQERITESELTRDIKKMFFSTKELEAEGELLKAQIGRFSRLDAVLMKQKRLGVYNAIDRQHFGLQRGLLSSDLTNRQIDLEKSYYSFASLLNADPAELKQWILRIKSDPPLAYAAISDVDSPALADLVDADITKSLERDFNLATLEHEKYVRFPLPSLYIKAFRELPTFASSDGPRWVGEAGLSVPLDTWITSGSQKRLLGARAEKAHGATEKALLEYRAAVRSNVVDLIRLRSENKNLHSIEHEADQLVDRAFLLYSQKRIDAIGTLDIIQKHLSAARALLQNELQLKIVDAELEHLLGGHRP